MTLEERFAYYSEKACLLWQRPGHRENVGVKISEALVASKELRSAKISSLMWFNDGSRNVRKSKCPGDGWQRGRV